MDRNIRRLQRLASQGDVGAATQLLVERIRIGELEAWQVEAAAWLEDPAALLLFPEPTILHRTSHAAEQRYDPKPIIVLEALGWAHNMLRSTALSIATRIWHTSGGHGGGGGGGFEGRPAIALHFIEGLRKHPDYGDERASSHSNFYAIADAVEAAAEELEEHSFSMAPSLAAQTVYFALLTFDALRPEGSIEFNAVRCASAAFDTARIAGERKQEIAAQQQYLVNRLLT